MAGFTVLEMASLGPVPFCGMMLADLGAEVIRIERTDSSAAGPPMDPRFDLLSRGRRSIALDLKQPQGVEIALRLAATANVLIEGMRPGVMERLGLGPQECLDRNAALVYGRMTGWGQTGPLAHRAGHDINYIALNGVLHSIGARNGPPVPPINLIGDYGGGAMFLIAGILAALLEAGASGKGQVIDASMLDGSSYLMTTIHMFNAAGLWQPERGSNLLDGGAPFYAVYETADGQYMAVGAIEPKFYREFVAGLGLDFSTLPDPQDPANWDALRATFAEAFRTRTREAWTETYLDRDACVSPVLSIEESALHNHNRQRETFVSCNDFTAPNAAPRFSRTGTNACRPIPRPGEHSQEILRDLDFTDHQISDLIRRKVATIPGS